MQRVSLLLTVLTLLNLGLLAFTLSQRAAPVSADTAPAILRGRGLEIVDSTGKLRASITVIPAGPARRADGSLSDQSGKIYPEAVVLSSDSPRRPPIRKDCNISAGIRHRPQRRNRSHLHDPQCRRRRHIPHPDQ